AARAHGRQYLPLHRLSAHRRRHRRRGRAHGPARRGRRGAMTAYVRPATLAQALEARAAHPDHTILCGGTDLLVAASRKPEPPGIIDLFGLDELTGVRAQADGSVVIGAATTYAQILASE